jgi:hypothetical protein
VLPPDDGRKEGTDGGMPGRGENEIANNTGVINRQSLPCQGEFLPD